MEIELSEQIQFIYAVYGYPKEDIPAQPPNKKIWDFFKGGLGKREGRNARTVTHNKTQTVSRQYHFTTCENVAPDQLQQLRYFGEMFFWRTRTLQNNYGKSPKSCGLSMIIASTQKFINHYNEFIRELDGKFLIFYGQIFYEVLAITDIAHFMRMVQEAMKFKLFDKRDKPHVKLFLRLNAASAKMNDLSKSVTSVSKKAKKINTVDNIECESKSSE